MSDEPEASVAADTTTVPQEPVAAEAAPAEVAAPNTDAVATVDPTAAAAVPTEATPTPVAAVPAGAGPPPVAMAHDGIITTVGEHDVVLSDDGSSNTIREFNFKMNLFLQDWILMQRILWKLQDKPKPTQAEDVQALVESLIKLIREGKPAEMAGLNDVPKQFLKNCGGRFLSMLDASSYASSQGGGFKVMDETKVQQVLSQLVLSELQKELIGGGTPESSAPILSDSPYKEFKDMLQRKQPTAGAILNPEPADAILFQALMTAATTASSTTTETSTDKLYEQQMGNRTVFNMASQLVTTFSSSSAKRVEAALFLLQGLDDAEVLQITTPPAIAGVSPIAAAPYAAAPAAAAAAATTTPGAAVPTTTKARARFLLRQVNPADESAVTWTVLDPVTAAEFALTFVFEVYLEKALDIKEPPSAAAVATTLPPGVVPMIEGGGVQQQAAAAIAAVEAAQQQPVIDTTIPIDNPNDADVLFGRGGMTNSHPGNKRFRDIIALHRPDYIRAVKMDKPLVARKIVRAIRHGPRPGRFLKKQADGHWHDVGDRTASEKTSQGLRERTNAEKRQRSALREALRIRRQDMTEESDGATTTPAAKKAKTESATTGASAASAAATAASDGTGAASSPMHILNYVGTNLAVPLSLGMKDPPSRPTMVKRPKNGPPLGADVGIDDLQTEGLPPNAVDEFGNILVTDYDILCGRGGLTNHHKGNKRFRDVVALHRPDYVRAPKIQKPSVARVIVRAIRNGDPPGRFLRKDEKTGLWFDIGDKKASEKTSQALREKTNEERDKVRRDPAVAAALGVLLPNPASYLTAAGAAAAATTAPYAAAQGAAAASPASPPGAAAPTIVATPIQVASTAPVGAGGVPVASPIVAQDMAAAAAKVVEAVKEGEDKKPEGNAQDGEAVQGNEEGGTEAAVKTEEEPVKQEEENNTVQEEYAQAPAEQPADETNEHPTEDTNTHVADPMAEIVDEALGSGEV